MVAVAEAQEARIDPELRVYGHATSGALGWIGGVSLLIAAAGLWVMPGANWDPMLMLVKLGLSLFLLCGGIMFLMAARRPVYPEVWLDGRLGRMRLVERESGVVIREVVIGYHDLSEIDFRDGMLIARDHHGCAVIEMPVENAGDFDDIRAALGPEFARAA